MDWTCFETRRTLDEITEGRMKGKPTRGRRRIQTLHDSASDDSHVALKQAAELRTERDGDRERMSKPVVQQKTTELRNRRVKLTAGQRSRRDDSPVATSFLLITLAVIVTRHHLQTHRFYPSLTTCAKEVMFLPLLVCLLAGHSRICQ